MNSGFPRNEFRPGAVSEPVMLDSPRIGNLIRGGQLYLSLEDAISLALENNLDLELERFGVRMATTDTVRAQGGGALRGVPLFVNEAPAGIGGPSGSPLLTTAATGATPQSTVSVSVTDTQLIAESQDNLGVTGTFPFAGGPAIPLYDPAFTAQLLGQRSNTPQTNLGISGSTDLTSNTFMGRTPDTFSRLRPRNSDLTPDSHEPVSGPELHRQYRQAVFAFHPRSHRNAAPAARLWIRP